MLEEEYRTAYETNEWHRKVELPNGETVVFHGPDVLVLFPPAQATADVWGNTPVNIISFIITFIPAFSFHGFFIANSAKTESSKTRNG